MSTTEDTQTDESTDTRTPDEIANQAKKGHANGTISRATVHHAYADDEGFYVELTNKQGVKSTRKLTTLLAGYAAALFDELEEQGSVTTVGHMSGSESALAIVELEPYDFEALDESDVAFRQRVIKNMERVI